MPTKQAEASWALVGNNTIAENYAFIGVHHIFDQVILMIILYLRDKIWPVYCAFDIIDVVGNVLIVTNICMLEVFNIGIINTIKNIYVLTFVKNYKSIFLIKIYGHWL